MTYHLDIICLKKTIMSLVYLLVKVMPFHFHALSLTLDISNAITDGEREALKSGARDCAPLRRVYASCGSTAHWYQSG
jgi:hypothetical protein